MRAEADQLPSETHRRYGPHVKKIKYNMTERRGMASTGTDSLYSFMGRSVGVPDLVSLNFLNLVIE